MSIVDVTDLSHFQSLLSSSGNKLVVVDFTATWCGPCRMIAPVFESLASQYEGRALFLKVDVDAASDVSQFCSVSSMPTFHGYRNANIVFNFSGADREQLTNSVAANAPSQNDVSFSGSGQALGGGGAAGPKVDWDYVSPEARRAQAAEAASKRFGSAAPAAPAAAAPVEKKKPPSKAAAAAMDSLLAAEALAADQAVSDAADAETAAAASSAPAAIQSGVSSVMLASLLEMGFPRPRAVRALHATHSKSAEVAMEWCFEHSEDATKDAPLSELEDVVADPLVAPVEAPKSKLTPEERQKKADELLVRARTKRAAEEKAAEIAREKDRVRQGKEIGIAQAKMEAQERKKIIEERKAEKKAQIEERAKIREKIAADKEARMKKFNMVDSTPKIAAASSASTPAAAAPKPTAPSGGKIQFRLPDGARIEGSFGSDATLGQAAGFVAKERPDIAASGFQLSSQYPKKVFTEGDMLGSLADFQLLPRGALTVSLK